MTIIKTIEELEAVYDEPGEASLIKVADRLIPSYRSFVEASPFVVLATAGPDGLDCSPRGDRGSAVTIRDDRTLLMADRRGNNRIDSLRNIVRDNRVALIFLVPGSTTTVRVNGTAEISVDPELCASLAIEGKAPRSVIIITIEQVYFQCARALIRAQLWEAEAKLAAAAIASPGVMLKEMKDSFDAAAYDAAWPERARNSMW